MPETRPWLECALAMLATWRVTHLLAKEDGPGDLLVHLRRRLGEGRLGKLMDCFYCLSLWVAAPLAFWAGRGPVGILVAWLALSGAACLLERLGQGAHRMEDAQGESHGMLRRGPREAGEHADLHHTNRA
jgi:hypothetical protein